MAEGRDSKGKFVTGASGNPRGRPPKTALGSTALDPNGVAPLPRSDGWTSALTGIGTSSRDKRQSHFFRGSFLTYEEIVHLWEKNDLTAKAIEAVPAECFREGYEITIGDEGSYGDLKEQVEEELLDIGAENAIQEAYQFKNAFGGAAILLGVDDGQPLDQPLNVNRVHSLDWLTVLEPIEILPVAFYDDPTKANYGKPKYFQFNNFRPMSMYTGPEVTYIGANAKAKPPPSNSISYIHESRLVVFRGIQVSRYRRSHTSQVSPFWGASVVDRFIEVLRDFDVAYSGAGILSTDISQPVITIDGLKDMVARSEEKLRARMAALEMSRSVARAILLDSKEKFERQTTQLAGIPDILDRMSLRLSAAIGMPLSVLLGYSPTALGAPGDAEQTQWYNKIRSVQRREFTPVLRKFTTLIMQSLRKRKIPKKWAIRWHELERMTDAQRAEARLTQARADSMYIKAGVATPDEIRRSRFIGEYSFETQVQEKDDAPGFAAPSPAGLLPGSTPAVAAPGSPATAAAPGAPVPAGPNAHSVSGYARRNPTQPALEKNTQEGGDVTPVGKRDGLDDFEREIELSELANVRERRDTLRAAGELTSAVEALLDDMERLCLMALDEDA